MPIISATHHSPSKGHSTCACDILAESLSTLFPFIFVLLTLVGILQTQTALVSVFMGVRVTSFLSNKLPFSSLEADNCQIL